MKYSVFKSLILSRFGVLAVIITSQWNFVIYFPDMSCDNWSLYWLRTICFLFSHKSTDWLLFEGNLNWAQCIMQASLSFIFDRFRSFRDQRQSKWKTKWVCYIKLGQVLLIRYLSSSLFRHFLYSTNKNV